MPDAERLKKRRSSRACNTCRLRKVRCDYTTTGAPCTNCRLDGVDCVLEPRKRRRVAREDDTPLNVDNISSATQLAPQASCLQNSHQENDARDPKPHAHVHIGRTRASTSDLQGEEDGGVSPLFLESEDLSRDHVRSSTPHGSIPPSAQNVEDQDLDASATLGVGRDDLTLRPLACSLSAPDVDYLFAKGALTLPNAALLNICLSRYAEFVYPVLPLLDLGEFLHDLSTSRCRVSLLLLLSVIYAAVAFVEPKYVEQNGYTSKMEARRVHYEKAKLLFDLGAEEDKITMIQAALLLSTPHGDVNDHKDAWYWIGTATALAQSLGLHLDYQTRRGNRGEDSLRRRLWWCCYVREHIVAIGIGRPCRMSHYNVRMISVADCEVSMVPTASLLARFFPPGTRQSTSRLRLAILFIEKIRLCICLHNIVAAIYSTEYSSIAETVATTDLAKLVKADKVEECSREIELWVKMLPAEATKKETPTSLIQEGECSLVVSRIMLMSGYHLAIITLHRPAAFGSTTKAPVERSRVLIRWAAQQITDSHQYLHDQQLDGFLDASIVAILIGAIVVHMQDCRTGDNEIKRCALDNLERCLSFLRTYKGTYCSAGHALEVLERAARSARAVAKEHLALPMSVGDHLTPAASNVSGDAGEIELENNRVSSWSAGLGDSNNHYMAQLHSQAVGSEWSQFVPDI